MLATLGAVRQATVLDIPQTVSVIETAMHEAIAALTRLTSAPTVRPLLEDVVTN